MKQLTRALSQVSTIMFIDDTVGVEVGDTAILSYDNPDKREKVKVLEVIDHEKLRVARSDEWAYPSLLNLEFNTKEENAEEIFKASLESFRQAMIDYDVGSGVMTMSELEHIISTLKTHFDKALLISKEK